jgi:hypothetical protein
VIGTSTPPADAALTGVEVRYRSDGDFWDEVRAEYWQRGPCRIAVDPADAPFTRESVFAALTAPAEYNALNWVQVAATPTPTNVRDFRMVPLRTYGPRTEDLDFDGYFARVGEHVFGFNVHDLGARNPDLLPVAERFAAEFGNRPGEPPIRTWELDVFAGTYPVTPLGIHQDNGGVFSFCLHGRRTYLLWPAEHFTADHPDLGRPDRELIERHASAAVRIDVEPGLGVYWPPLTWHVVLGDGSPFVVGQVSAYMDLG